MQQFAVLVVLLVAAVGDVLGDCTAKTETLAAGDMSFGGKRGGGKCENTAAIEVTVECVGTCPTYSNITFVSGERPSMGGECKFCKIEFEKKEVNLKCTKDDGTTETFTKEIPIPSSCGCGDCKGKRGGRGGHGGKGGKGGKGDRGGRGGRGGKGRGGRGRG